MNCQIRKYLCIICASLFVLNGQAQDSQAKNPFELTWRKGNASTTATAKTAMPKIVADSADAISKTPAAVVQPPADKPVSADPEKTHSPPEQNIETAITEEPAEIRDPTESPAESIVQPEHRAADANGDAPIPIESPKVKRSIAPARSISAIALLLIFALIFILLTWVVNLDRGLIKKMYRAALNENYASLLLREHRFSTSRYLYYIVYALFFINGGLFLNFVLQYFGIHIVKSYPLLFSILLVFGLYIVRHIGLAVISHAFPVAKEASHFSFSVLIYNILLGLILIPVNLFLAFGPHSIAMPVGIFGLMAVGLLYLARQFRGLVIGSRIIPGGLFHFFIYLCAVEILPVLVLIKFLHN